jgi:hypothetical protein
MAGKQRNTDVAAINLATKIKEWNDKNTDHAAAVAELLALAEGHEPPDGWQDDCAFTSEERCIHALAQIHRALSFSNHDMATYYYELACSYCDSIPTVTLNALKSKQQPKPKQGKQPLNPCIRALRLGQAESLMLHVGLTSNLACDLVAEGWTNGHNESISGGAIYRDWDSRSDIYRECLNATRRQKAGCSGLLRHSDIYRVCLNATHGFMSFSPYADLDDTHSLIDAKFDADKFDPNVRKAIMLASKSKIADKTQRSLLKDYFA